MSRLVLSAGLIWVFFAFGHITPLQAQPYPNRPIQLVIPTTPGAGVDIVGRLVAEELGKILRIQIIPINKPGVLYHRDRRSCKEQEGRVYASL